MPTNFNISKRLIIYILLFSSLITLILTAIQLHLNYRYDLNLIEQRFQQIELTNVQSITQKAWTVNQKGMTDELESILKLPDITYIEFIPNEVDRVIVNFGAKAPHNIQHSVDIVYHYRNKDITLGQLNIYASLSNVYQRLIDTALIILGTQALKTFAVSFFIFLIFKMMITRHLSTIGDFLQNRALFENNKHLKLKRRENKNSENDELGSLVRSINRMIARTRSLIKTLDLTQQKLFQAQDLSGTAHWEYDANRKTFHLNAQFNKLLKLEGNPEYISLEEFLNIIDDKDQVPFLDNLDKARNGSVVESFEMHVKQPTKSLTFSVEITTLQHAENSGWLLGSMQDISKLASHRDRLEYLANTDTLTNLANRHQFHQQVEKRIQRIKQSSNYEFSVLIADVDRFKEINDALGHAAGDQLLVLISERFKHILKPRQLLARLGGDEFAFLIDGNEEEALDLISQLKKQTSQVFEISTLKINVSFSIGIAFAPQHSRSTEELLRQADIAMYSAKNRHTGAQIYSNDMDIHNIRRLELMTNLQEAINENQLELYYQPKIALNKGASQCIGFEALVRWNHPQYGLIPPDEFISYAEMSHTITPLTLWVIEAAIQQRQAFSEMLANCLVSINISSRNLHDIDFPRQVGNLMHQYQSKPEDFILEITESAIMEDPKQAASSIETLSVMGFQVSIDDFGTGYSSLAYLKNLPVNELKIDRTFVADMVNDESDYTIVKSTIDLAHNLGLKVTAEGVEDQKIEQALLLLECDIAQGYHYSRPLPLKDALSWLDSFQEAKAS